MTQVTLRRLRPSILASLIMGAGLVVSQGARAQQIDVNPPLPNALILLDNSGSMENMFDGTSPDTSGEACAFKVSPTGAIIANPAQAKLPSTGTKANRWGQAVMALTGTIAPYNCIEVPRQTSYYTNADSAFLKEFKIAGKAPYDTDYFLPYRRPASGGTNANGAPQNLTVLSPNKLPGAASQAMGVGQWGGYYTGACTPGSNNGGCAFDSPPDAIVGRSGDQQPTGAGWTNPVSPGLFGSNPDGVLDSNIAIIRFGLMTYDQDPSPITGVTLGANILVNSSAPFTGSWSYYPGWGTPFNNLNMWAGGSVQGEPADCTVMRDFEVGARNPAAPPWEGRLIPFSNSNASLLEIGSQNASVQNAILSLRPYGATPTAGLFADAKNYFWNDPIGPQKSDPYINSANGSGGYGCRDEYIILLTDGAPNLDLRPSCSNAPNNPNLKGTCPYDLPETIAQSLYANGASTQTAHSVKTFVIGLAVNALPNNLVCSSLSTNSPQCTSVLPADIATYGACCQLQRIALNGGTGKAYFADTPGDLQSALGAITAAIAQNTTTRTIPAYSPVVSNPGSNAIANATMFLASFSPVAGKPWTGDVQRERFNCTLANGTYTVPPPTIDPLQGDDYATNLAQQTPSSRNFYTVAADGIMDSAATIRKTSVTNDGIGTYGISSTVVSPSVSAMHTLIAPAHMNIKPNQCGNSNNTQFLSDVQCKDLMVDFLTAQSSTAVPLNNTYTPFAARNLAPLADIFHATPLVVAPPSALLRDESYQGFATTYAARPTIIYAPTNDGLLHAFDANTTSLTKSTSELWSFIPPAVLPRVFATYPGSHQLLLDGAPVVKDVVFDRTLSTVTNSSVWHSALVASFGAEGVAGSQSNPAASGGYYALDVTNPDPKALNGGPKFLWQLTHMPKFNNAADVELFATHSATPALTTVYATLDGGSTTHEIAVAILPGGYDPAFAPNAQCARAVKTVTNDASPSAFPSRAAVRCWSNNNAPVVGRSVTIVRVDTGEVLATFARTADAPNSLQAATALLGGSPPLGSKGRVLNTPLDSPMSGTPIVYPSGAGAIAQKVFIGDMDGTVWRFNLTDPNPNNWTGELYLDTYNTTVDKNATAWSDGQPIQTSPVVALDRLGQLVVSIATGDTELYTANVNMLNYVYSTTEKSDGTKLRSSVNWYLPFTGGERVSGPMAVFDGALYFASFAAASSQYVCQNGLAKMWGRDYTAPFDPNNIALGGAYKMLDPNTKLPVSFIDPVSYGDTSIAGKVIPGVSVNFTPACASTSVVPDPYSGGTHTTADNVTSGSYSLVASVGSKNSQGGTKVVGGNGGVSLPKPKTSTIVDSWASIVE